MDYRKVLLLVMIMLLLPFTLKLRGADFGQGQSLFTDIKAHKVGDILTVHIYEQSRASNQVETKTSKSQKADAQGGPGIGTFSFFPMFSADWSSKSNFDGKGEKIRNGSLRAKMSVTVVAVKASGDLIIEGSRTVGISGDQETLFLTGIVRQKDISPSNTIASYLIADAEIHYNGKGVATTGSRPGFFTRVLNWIF